MPRQQEELGLAPSAPPAPAPSLPSQPRPDQAQSPAPPQHPQPEQLLPRQPAAGPQQAAAPPPAQLDGRSARYTHPASLLAAALASPPAPSQFGVAVSHATAHRGGPAAEVIAELLEVPQALVERLIWFGAAYACPVVPLPPKGRGPAMDEAQRGRIAAARADALATWGNDSRHQTPRRLSDPAAPLPAGAYLRLHCHPKRFPAAHATDWASRLLAVAKDHVVVNKPHGLQVPPTVDNIQESLLACVERELSLPPGALLPAHRLDAGTEGVVVLARSPAFAAWFRELMAHRAERGAVVKVYRCCVAAPPPPAVVGRPLVHHVLQDVRAPGEMAHSVIAAPDTPGAARAELVVEESRPVALCPEAAAAWGCDTAHELSVRLVTGRTHQVRVQMAALGLPLLGDRLYGALAETGGLHHPPSGGSGSEAGSDSGSDSGAAGPQAPAAGAGAGGQAVRRPGRAVDWCVAAIEQQLAPVALQAHSLAVLEDGPMGRAPVTHCAGEPWWRARDGS